MAYLFEGILNGKEAEKRTQIGYKRNGKKTCKRERGKTGKERAEWLNTHGKMKVLGPPKQGGGREM